VVVANADGSNPIKIAAGESMATETFSPDGKQLIYASEEKGAKDKLFIVNSDGSGRREIPWPGASVFLAIWSPDAKSIFVTGFEQGGSTPTYWIGDIDGSNWKKAGSDCGMLSDISRDNKMAVGAVWRGAKMGTYSFSLDDGKCTSLLPGVATFFTRFTPDEKWIQWTVTGTHDMTIYRMPWKAGHPAGEQQIAFKLPFSFPLSDAGNGFDFTRDLSYVVYVKPGGHADLYFTPLK